VVDDVLIDFGGMMMVPGKGFSANETSGASAGQNDSTLYVRSSGNKSTAGRCSLNRCRGMKSKRK